MIIKDVHLTTKLEVWNPKFSEQYKDEYSEPVVLLHKRKVDYASPKIIVEFTRSTALKGQRFAISRSYAQSHKIGTNGKAPMYEIPMSHFETWVSGSEVVEKALNNFKEKDE